MNAPSYITTVQSIILTCIHTHPWYSPVFVFVKQPVLMHWFCSHEYFWWGQPGTTPTLYQIYVIRTCVHCFRFPFVKYKYRFRECWTCSFHTEGGNHLFASCSFPAGQVQYRSMAVNGPLHGVYNCMGSHCDCVGRYDKLSWMASYVEG